jgi:hypothetical protein
VSYHIQQLQLVPYSGGTQHFGLTTMQDQEQEAVKGTHGVWYLKVFSTQYMTKIWLPC